MLSHVSALAVEPVPIVEPAASLELERYGALPVIFGRKPLLPKPTASFLPFALCFRLIILLLEKTISFVDAPPINIVKMVGMADLQKFEAW